MSKVAPGNFVDTLEDLNKAQTVHL